MIKCCHHDEASLEKEAHNCLIHSIHSFCGIFADIHYRERRTRMRAWCLPYMYTNQCRPASAQGNRHGCCGICKCSSFIRILSGLICCKQAFISQIQSCHIKSKTEQLAPIQLQYTTDIQCLQCAVALIGWNTASQCSRTRNSAVSETAYSQSVFAF